MSTAIGPDTGLPTVFVYDGYPGGAGFAERGFRRAATWLSATADAIEACECPQGCPSCVQSPKCGNGNEPLDKRAAVHVLRLVASRIDRPRGLTTRPLLTTDPSTVALISALDISLLSRRLMPKTRRPLRLQAETIVSEQHAQPAPAAKTAFRNRRDNVADM